MVDMLNENQTRLGSMKAPSLARRSVQRGKLRLPRRRTGFPIYACAATAFQGSTSLRMQSLSASGLDNRLYQGLAASPG